MQKRMKQIHQSPSHVCIHGHLLGWVGVILGLSTIFLSIKQTEIIISICINSTLFAPHPVLKLCLSLGTMLVLTQSYSLALAHGPFYSVLDHHSWTGLHPIV